MEIKIISGEIDPFEYNQKARHPLQSWEWGEAKKLIGNKILRFGDANTNYLMTIHNIPYTSYKIGYIPRSPQLSAEDIQFLVNYSKKHQIIYIKMEPDTYKNEFNPSIFGSYKKMIRKSPHPLFPDWTMIIDLRKSEDELLKNMKSKTRYNINLAIRKGVTVRVADDETGLVIFSKLYFETCKRQKYYGHSQDYHEKVWRSLKNKIAHILIAEFEGEPLAAYELFHFGNAIYYPYGGTSEKFRNLMAANLIMWEAIKLGKKLGASYFDMWGSLSPDYDKNHDWAGFTRFKEGYGAEFKEMAGSYDIVIDNVAYHAVNILNNLRNQLLKSGRI